MILSHNWDADGGGYTDEASGVFRLPVTESGWTTESIEAPIILPEKTVIELNGIRIGNTNAVLAGKTVVTLFDNKDVAG